MPARPVEDACFVLDRATEAGAFDGLSPREKLARAYELLGATRESFFLVHLSAGWRVWEGF